MIRIRPHRLQSRLHRSIAYSAIALILLVLGQLLESLGLVMIAPQAWASSVGSFPGDSAVLALWSSAWPLLLDWAQMVGHSASSPMEAEVPGALEAWVVLLPLALLSFLLGFAELLALRPELNAWRGQLRAELEPMPEPMLELKPEPSVGPPPGPVAGLAVEPQRAMLFEALDGAELQLAEMQAELEGLQAAILNASLPQPLDDADEPLEQARLACDLIRDHVRGLRAQQQIIQARAMGFRA